MHDKELETKALLKLLDQARAMIAGEMGDDAMEDAQEKPLWNTEGSGTMQEQAPDMSPEHEAAETPEMEREEHATGMEMQDENDPMAAIRDEQKKFTQGGSKFPQKNAVMAAMAVKVPKRK